MPNDRKGSSRRRNYHTREWLERKSPVASSLRCQRLQRRQTVDKSQIADQALMLILFEIAAITGPHVPQRVPRAVGHLADLHRQHPATAAFRAVFLVHPLQV